MFHRLMQRTGERGLEFGVKITNTFPVDVAAGELPSEEMYMSGRSLYPLSLSLAARLARSSRASCASPIPAARDYQAVQGVGGRGHLAHHHGYHHAQVRRLPNCLAQIGPAL